MSRKGNCPGNAPTVSFFFHLKEESLRHIKIKDFKEAVQVGDDYIHFYTMITSNKNKTDAFRIQTSVCIIIHERILNYLSTFRGELQKGNRFHFTLDRIIEVKLLFQQPANKKCLIVPL
jgi:hypothetical protein